MMHGRGKSSPVIVARKPANKADPETVSAAESVERRAEAEGNANQHARTGLRAGRSGRSAGQACHRSWDAYGKRRAIARPSFT